MKSMQIKPDLILLMMMLYNTLLVPVIAVTYSYNTLTLATCGAALLILLAADAFMWWQHGRVSQSGAYAIRIGMLSGLLWVAEISVNNFIAPPLPMRDTIDNIFWAVIAGVILSLAGISAYRAKSIQAGMKAGTWSGFASGALACGMALSLIVFGMGFITRDPLNITEWAARGAGSSAPGMAAYFAFETLAGGLMHLVILGLAMGALLGILGGALGTAIRYTGNPDSR